MHQINNTNVQHIFRIDKSTNSSAESQETGNFFFLILFKKKKHKYSILISLQPYREGVL